LWLAGEIISSSYWMCRGLMMLGREQYTQKNH